MYKQGGGAFLLPYFVCVLFCGIPLLFTELALGQFTGRGPIGAIGQCVPLLKGETRFCYINKFNIQILFTTNAPRVAARVQMIY